MNSFLGVPIKVRDAVFGNLYLTGRRTGEFTESDEELMRAVAGTAAVAIENARLYDEGRRRERWLHAAAEVSQQLLSFSGEDPLRVIARSVQELADADLVTVVLPSAAPGELMIEVAVGLGADRLTGLAYSTEHSIAGAVIEANEPIRIEDIEEQLEFKLRARDVVPVSAVMGLPLAGSAKPRGCLMVTRLSGRRGFTDNDLQMATLFANHAAVALELADARSYQQRTILLEDRDRIARDLHDHVIQRLFAAGLTVQSLQARHPDSAAAAKLGQVVNDLDDTIRQIRTSIFDLHGTLSPAPASVRTELLAMATEHVAQLGFEPTLRFSGPVDTLVTPDLAKELAAVLREALSNVARHARASGAEVAVEVSSSRLSLSVSDNGVGLGASTRRSGLANLTERATRRGGTLTVTQQSGRRNAAAMADSPDLTATPIRIFLLDDHEIVRRGIADLLSAADDMEVVGEAGTAAEALRRIPAVRPDVALLDGRLPDGSGIDVCRDIRSSHPDVRCLILTSYDDDDALFAAVMAGASGYLLKEIRGSSLLEGIRQVRAGRSLLDPTVTERVMQRLRAGQQTDPRLAGLTERERQILDLIAEGLTNRQIGERLFLAEKTVKNYVSALLAKLGMQRRTQAAVFGSELKHR